MVESWHKFHNHGLRGVFQWGVSGVLSWDQTYTFDRVTDSGLANPFIIYSKWIVINPINAIAYLVGYIVSTTLNQFIRPKRNTL